MTYRWAGVGDINAFFGLMLDNVVNLVLLAGLLIGAFGFPADIIFTHMFPGTALGVMFGDLVYTWLAFRLAKKTGRDVTAMPLGLDSPSTIGMALAVLGPAFLAAKGGGMNDHDAGIHAWHVGMAVMVIMGVIKFFTSFIGSYIQKAIPAAGLLGTLGGIGIALIGTLQFGELLHEPIVGFAAMGVLWYSLISKIKLPFGAPEVGASALVGTLIYYALMAGGLAHTPVDLAGVGLTLAFPWPSLGFLQGMNEALTTYLPLAIPFALLTVIGGINVTESARLAGDDYDTREILLTEAAATLLAGICGGVSQSTPYIGQPAYKAMGGKAAYTLATGLFVGLGGMLGYIPLMAAVLPKSALIPILLFVGVDIVEQSFHAVPKKHAMASAFAFFPNIANLVLITMKKVNFWLLFAITEETVTDGFVLGKLKEAKALVPPGVAEEAGIFLMLGNGFILTGMLWGGALAFLADRKQWHAAGTLVFAAVLTLFGIIHSCQPSGSIYLPWNAGSHLNYEWAVGYLVIAAMIVVLSFSKEFREVAPESPEHAHV